MTGARILLVEDDADLREALAAALAADGHDVAVADAAPAAFEALAAGPHDLVLLDVALGPGPDGIDICRRLRRVDDDVYVMMLTARDAEPDVVVALEAGADDYVAKPVGIAELRSRVRAALRRRVRLADTDHAALRHAELTLEPASRCVRVGARPLALTPSEYAVLEVLLRADGAVRSRAQLLTAMYGDGARRHGRGVDVHVHHLREKLAGAGGDPGWVATVRGAGYRIAR